MRKGLRSLCSCGSRQQVDESSDDVNDGEDAARKGGTGPVAASKVRVSRSHECCLKGYCSGLVVHTDLHLLLVLH